MEILNYLNEVHLMEKQEKKLAVTSLSGKKQLNNKQLAETEKKVKEKSKNEKFRRPKSGKSL